MRSGANVTSKATSGGGGADALFRMIGVFLTERARGRVDCDLNYKTSIIS